MIYSSRDLVEQQFNEDSGRFEGPTGMERLEANRGEQVYVKGDYSVHLIPAEFRFIKDDQFVMNYTVTNDKTSRIEAFFPTLAAAKSTAFNLDQQLQQMAEFEAQLEVAREINAIQEGADVVQLKPKDVH